MKNFITLFALLSISVSLCFGAKGFQQGFNAYNNKDFAHAVRVWKESCNSGEAKSCNILALMHDNGEYFDQDRTKARHYYQKACDLGDSVGCEFVKKLRKMGY
ncbi:MAG: tetratricopeptide repeat protein [Campylobacterota bacterium]